ncbi:MAG: hypothetical protein ACYDCQ_22720, partial [Dehalococcoidia bacterium]
DRIIVVNARRNRSPVPGLLVAAALATFSLLAAACARNPRAGAAASGAVGSASPTAGASASTAHLACLTGLRSYRFGGTLSLQLGPGATAQQLGSLVNLLQDVRFNGASLAPSASTLNLTFGGALGAQSLQTERIGGQLYVKGTDGKWQVSPGNGPILSALSQLDPQRLCDQTIATVSTIGMQPARETVDGVSALHYRFGPDQLANSPGVLGRDTADAADAGAGGPSSLDVWETVHNPHPVRIRLASGIGGQSGGTGSLKVTIDITDINNGDISIMAPL